MNASASTHRPRRPDPHRRADPLGVRGWQLALIGTAMLAALALAGWGRLTGSGDPAAGLAPVAAERLIAFRHDAFVGPGSGGPVAVVAAEDGRRLLDLPEGGEGFIRGLHRALMHERKRHGVSPEAPFRLSRRQDGRYVLEDLALNRVLALESYGHSNVEAMARLLR
jgi:putative photosynthetic complex assembly protein